MSCLIQTYATGQALIEGLYGFLILGHTTPPAYTGTGTGYIDDAIGTATSVFETITITFTSPTAFQVVGSVTGALGTGTVGTLFTSVVFQGTVQAGSTAWAAGDTIIMTMTAPWVSKVHTAAAQYTFVAPGNDNNGGPTMSLLCSSNATTNYFNATIAMYPVWQDGVAEVNQYKRLANSVWTLGPAAGQTCTLYAVADGKFCYAVSVIGSTYSAACFGWMTPTHNRLIHPQPLLYGGNAYSAVQWSDSGCRSPVYASTPAGWVPPSTYNALISTTRFCYAMLPPGRWAAICGYDCENSETYGDMTNVPTLRQGSRQQVNLDGSIPLTPIEIRTTTNVFWSWGQIYSGNWGVFPFVYVIPCYNTDGSLIAGSLIWRDSVTRRRYVTVQNGYVNDASNTYALELA